MTRMNNPIGAQPASTHTAAQGAKFALGTRGTDEVGDLVYVQASAAVTQYHTVGITEDYKVASITKALADAGHAPGFAQIAFAASEFGWVYTHAPGNVTIKVAGSCAADVQLYTTASAGVLDDTAASQTAIRGVVAVATNGTTIKADIEAIAQYPSSTATA